ncbi:hypothetical protein ACSQ67_010324 [Phaseolus vulgaris]
MSFPLLFHLWFLGFCFISSLARGATIPEDEVKVMKEIAETLGKKDWDFSVDPCSGQRNWSVEVKGFENAVTCNCHFANATICHVVSIVLKSQNLSGTLPSELVRLPYLQEIDLSRNYLNGTIPAQWGFMKLVNIVLEFNQLSGELPPELGNLHQLERLAIVVNYNEVMQGSGFSGPIPYGISFLNNLTDLRISDLKGPDSQFPQLKNLTILQTLIPRSCNLIGMVPEYLGNVTSLRSLH